MRNFIIQKTNTVLGENGHLDVNEMDKFIGCLLGMTVEPLTCSIEEITGKTKLQC